MVSSATGIARNTDHPAEAGIAGSAKRTQRKNDPGLVEACNLVQSIFEQVTLGDSPPINEEGANGDAWLYGKRNDIPPSVRSAAYDVNGMNANNKFCQTDNRRANPFVPSTNSDASTLSNSTASAAYSFNGGVTSKFGNGPGNCAPGPRPPMVPSHGFSRQRHVLPVHPEYYQNMPPSSIQKQGGSPITPTVGGRNTVSTTSLSPMSTVPSVAPSVHPSQSTDTFQMSSEVLPEGNPSADLGEPAVLPHPGTPGPSPRVPDAVKPLSPDTTKEGSVASAASAHESLLISNSHSSEQCYSSEQVVLTPKICSSIVVDTADCHGHTGPSIETPASMSAVSAASALQQPLPPPQISRAHLPMPQYRTKSEMTMGNMALASLCARTLDSVASTAASFPSSLPSNESKEDLPSMDDEDEQTKEENKEEEKETESNNLLRGRSSKFHRRKRRSTGTETQPPPPLDVDQTPKRHGSSWMNRNSRSSPKLQSKLKFSPKRGHRGNDSEDEDDGMPSYQRLTDSDHFTDSDLDQDAKTDDDKKFKEDDKYSPGYDLSPTFDSGINPLSSTEEDRLSKEEDKNSQDVKVSQVANVADKYSEEFVAQRTFDSEIQSLNSGWDDIDNFDKSASKSPMGGSPIKECVDEENSAVDDTFSAETANASEFPAQFYTPDVGASAHEPDNKLAALDTTKDKKETGVVKSQEVVDDQKQMPQANPLNDLSTMFDVSQPLKEINNITEKDVMSEGDDNLLLMASNSVETDGDIIENVVSDEMDPAPPSDCSVSSASSESSSSSDSSESSSESSPSSPCISPSPDRASSPCKPLLAPEPPSSPTVEIPDDPNQNPLVKPNPTVAMPTSPRAQVIPAYLQKNQMQMFGSEYARFLSSTPFSPAVKKPKNRKKKLLSKFGGSRASQSQKEESGSVSSGPSAHAHASVQSSAALSSTSMSVPKEGGPPNLEDASEEILTGAITDVLVTHGSEKPPRGYYRISQTGDGTSMNSLKRANASGATSMVPGRKQTSVYLNVKKEPNWDRAVQRPCVTALAIIFPDRNEFVPPGFCVVRRYKSRSSQSSQGSSAITKESGKGRHRSVSSDKRGADRGIGQNSSSDRNSEGSTAPANLNFGTLGERVYLCYRRSREGNPITGIIPLLPHKGEAIPEGYTVLERTPRNYVADVNCKAGAPLFLAFRQRLANLEPLRPLPLVLSVYYSNPEDESDPSSSLEGGCSRSTMNKYLCAYYCTGGTVVPSNVGRFHIMDRSTHPLLSPSSVTNRLSLIQASRRQRAAASGSTPSSTTSTTSMSAGGTHQRESQDSLSKPLTSPTFSAISTNRKKKNKLPGVLMASKSASPKNLMRRSRRDLKLSARDDSKDGNDPTSDFPSRSPTIGAGTEIALHHNDLDSVVSSSSSDLLSRKQQRQRSKEGLHQGSGREPHVLPTSLNAFDIDGPDIYSPTDKESLHQGSMGSDPFEADESGADSTCTTGSSLSSPHPFSHPTPTFQKEQRMNRRGIFCHEDSVLQSCFDAMDFIPLVEDAFAESEDNPSLIREEQRDTHLMILQARVAVLTPILTSCYTHHGGSALLAVEGLTKLLNETDFFLTDVVPDDRTNVAGDLEGSSSRLTLLDLSLQVVCDVATSTSRETTFSSCVEFVSDAVRYAKCRLNTRTIGYVLRFYLFVFYFGASVPTASSWPNTMRGVNNTHRSFRGGIPGGLVDVALLDEGETDKQGRKKYLPGGAPQIAALALKELVALIVQKMKSYNSDNALCDLMAAAQFSGGKTSDFMRGLLSNIIDGAMHRVDVANYTQLALHQIHRSGGSELFWHDMMTSCGIGLFGHDPSLNLDAKNGFVVTFAVLASLVKVSSGKVRRVAQTSDLVPRDVASKLLSLELLLHFLQQWRTVFLRESEQGDTTSVKDAKSTASSISSERSNCEARSSNNHAASVATMVYTIRRLVVPCLLSNTGSGLEDSRVFRRMIRIVSELWCTAYYREHMKMELGVLIEHFVLKILRLGPMVLPPKRLRELGGKLGRGANNLQPSSLLDDISSPLLPQQIDVLNEVKRCFTTKENIVLELFINYDIEDSSNRNTGRARMLPGTQWKITQQLCGALCTLAEQCGDMISDQIRVSSLGGSTVGVRGGVSAGAALSSAIVAPQSTPPHSTMTGARSEDITEITRVREGARVLQEKSYYAVGLMIKSLMGSAAQTSGHRWKQFLSTSPSLLSASSYNKRSSRGRGKFSFDNDADSLSDVSSKESSKKSWSSWKHGLRRSETASTGTAESGAPTSPRRHLSPIRTASSAAPKGSGDGNIVEYWQTSIATERRKVSASSPAPEDRRKKNASPEKYFPASNVSSPMSRLSRTNNSWGNRVARPRSTPTQITMDTTSQTMTDQAQKDTGKGVQFVDLDQSSSFQQKTEDTLNVAFEIMATKNLKKALDYLIACNYLTPSPRDVASFLRINQVRLDQVALGEYLGEGGKDGADVEYWNLIRFNYVRAISFVGMNVEQGLRHFLTNSGFRLPGEAQKIDRVISTFSQCYWEDNAGDHLRCPFHDQDTVFLISFAIIMLNTDLHKSNSSVSGTPSSSGRKQRKKMTKTEFMNNLRGVDNSEDLSRDYLSAIYDSIEAQPIALFHQHDELNSSVKSASSKYSGAKSRMSLAAAENVNDLTSLLKSLIRSVKPAQELLRGLAVHDHPFLSVSDYDEGNDGHIMKGLVRTAIGATWHHFHGAINATLDTAHLDPNGLVLCLDVLKYSLCATICLDMSMERSAFVTQLARVKLFKESRGLDEDVPRGSKHTKPSLTCAHHDHQAFKNESWYKKLEGSCSEPTNERRKQSAIDQINRMIQDLHSSLEFNQEQREVMKHVVSCIRNGEVFLNDPARTFIREGDLIKRSNHVGRSNNYRFFLFSDLLVYAHRSSSTKRDYKIHGELPLHLMKVIDDDCGGGKKHMKSFFIQHPHKSFLLFAANPEMKKTWVADITLAIKNELERKARVEGARLASMSVDR